MKFKTLCLFVLFFSYSAFAGDLNHGKPESVGMSSEALNRITDIGQGYVDRNQLTGIHVLVAKEGVIVYDEALGKRSTLEDTALDKDALYRIYSMTKPITAVAAMQLHEAGKFELSDPVSKYIPEFENLKVYDEGGEPVAMERTMTVQHILTHTAGFGYVFNRRHPVVQQYMARSVLGSQDLEEMVLKLRTVPLMFQPGERWYYSIAVDLTGLLVERWSGQSFDEYLDEHVFTPLEMHDTYFQIPEESHSRLLPSNNWNREENVVVSRPVGPNDYRDVSFYSGGGGLISTGMDYLRFAEMLRRKGDLDGARILSAETVDDMTRNHLPEAMPGSGQGDAPERAAAAARANTFGFGLGFGLRLKELEDGSVTDRGVYNWGGAAGTVFWIDPDEDLILVMMIQMMGQRFPVAQEIEQAIRESLISET